MFSKRKIRFIATVFAVAVAALVCIQIGIYVMHISSEAHRQQVREAAFYCYALDMDSVSNEEISLFSDLSDLDDFTVTFIRVEYVMDFPAADERKWFVIYIKPEGKQNSGSSIPDSTGTQGAIDRLNRLIANDPSIVVDQRLTIPLTVEQAVERPDAVLKVVKQLDRGQWEKLFGEYDLLPAENLARAAGIEVPTE